MTVHIQFYQILLRNKKSGEYKTKLQLPAVPYYIKNPFEWPQLRLTAQYLISENRYIIGVLLMHIII